MILDRGANFVIGNKRLYVTRIAIVVTIMVMSGCADVQDIYYGVVGRMLRESGGRREILKTNVQFIYTTGIPVSSSAVYIIQTIGDDMLITDLMQTDKLGTVHLNGSYCFPMAVAIEGAFIGIKSGGDLPPLRETVPVRGGPSPSAAFGLPDARYLGYTNKHSDCG